MWNNIGILFTVCFLVDPFFFCQIPGRYCYYLLDEVEARLCFDCPLGKLLYNDECHNCHTSCTKTSYKESSSSDTVLRSQLCDSFDADCYSCTKGKYGVSCELPCDDRCDSNGCGKYSGNCFRCDNGYWGDTCSSSCPVSCCGSRCDQMTGECNVCERGLTGDMCDVACQDGWVGPRCQCSENFDRGLQGCDQNTGVCTSCRHGYFGLQCNEKCSSSCLQNKDGEVHCDISSGGCLRPCLPGYSGDTCADAIDQGVDEGPVVGAAVGGLFGGIVLSAVVAVILVYFWRRSQKSDLRDRHHQEQTSDIAPQPPESAEPLSSLRMDEVTPGPMPPIYDRLRSPASDTVSGYQSPNEASRGSQTDGDANYVIDDTRPITNARI